MRQSHLAEDVRWGRLRISPAVASFYLGVVALLSCVGPSLADEPRVLQIEPEITEVGVDLAAEELVPEQPRRLTNLTTGLRFQGRMLTLDQAPGNGKILYMGTRNGRVNISRDGGETWEEVAMLTAKARFFGAIRPMGATPPVLGSWYNPSPTSPSRAFPSNLPSRPIRLDPLAGPYDPFVGVGTSGDLNYGSESARGMRGFESGVRDHASSEYKSLIGELHTPAEGVSSAAGGGGGNKLAIGIKARAPRLAYQVRRRKGWGIGIGLKQTLVLKSGGGTGIWHMDVNPNNPNDVLASTSDGLRRTQDGGYSWPLVMTGTNRWERENNHVARHPHDPNRIYAGTVMGLNLSTDGGDTWTKVDDRWVVSSFIRWISFDKKRPEVMLVGTTSGLMRSDDWGKSFERIFRSPWPALKHVRQVEVDPHQEGRIWMATRDGILVSDDDGKSFERSGGMLFTGQYIVRFALGQIPDHVMVATSRDLWESRDGGKSWQIAYFGPIQWHITNLIQDVDNSDDFFILTEHEVLRFGPSNRLGYEADAMARAKAILKAQPTLTETMTVALRRAGLYREDLSNYRRRSRQAGYLPVVQAFASFQDYAFNKEFRNTEYYQNGDPIREYSSQMPWPETYRVGITASWNLDSTVYRQDESIALRIGRMNKYAEERLKDTVTALYAERHRLLFARAVDEGDERTRLFRNLRIEELTAHLNVLAGNLFEAESAL